MDILVIIPVVVFIATVFLLSIFLICVCIVWVIGVWKRAPTSSPDPNLERGNLLIDPNCPNENVCRDSLCLEPYPCKDMDNPSIGSSKNKSMLNRIQQDSPDSKSFSGHAARLEKQRRVHNDWRKTWDHDRKTTYVRWRQERKLKQKQSRNQKTKNTRSPSGNLSHKISESSASSSSHNDSVTANQNVSDVSGNRDLRNRESSGENTFIS